MKVNSGTYRAVVIGVSAGGIAALGQILPVFDSTSKAAIIIVQHVAPNSPNYLVEYFARQCRMTVCEAADKQAVAPGIIYFAPPNYHLLVEQQKSFALSVDAKVNYSRPAIDVLFETAADAYLDRLVGVILTGANDDGAAGLAAVKKKGGLTIVQSPETAEIDTMPKAAIARTEVDQILPLEEIGKYLNTLEYIGGE